MKKINNFYNFLQNFGYSRLGGVSVGCCDLTTHSCYP